MSDYDIYEEFQKSVDKGEEFTLYPEDFEIFIVWAKINGIVYNYTRGPKKVAVNVYEV